MKRLLAVLLPLFAATSMAELPTAAYFELQEKATEVFRIEIRSFRATRPAEGWERLQWTARVTSVIRSKTKVKVGTTIRFEVTQSAPDSMAAGPARARHLRAGTRTIVYLNRDKNGKFELAKYGRSFETTPRPPTPGN